MGEGASACTTDPSAELACEWILRRVQHEARGRWLQGRLSPPIACDVASPAVRQFAEWRLRRVPLAVGRALVAWAHGRRRAVLRYDVPTAREVLSLQARGARCVSLVGDDRAPAPHTTGLEFAIHDLCHLEKLADPEHHHAQVGFFHALEGALGSQRWIELEALLEAPARSGDRPTEHESWAAGRDHVLADMNGSAVFLFVAFKTKLLAAARRAGRDDALDTLCAALGLDGDVRAAAVAARSRASDPALLRRLHDHFVALGRAVMDPP